VDDTISKLTSNRQYSAASAYKLQFLELVQSSMYNIIWNSWTPQKVKIILDLYIKIYYRWRIDYKKEDGPIMAYILFASKLRNPMIIFFFSCQFTIQMWSLLRIDLVSMDCIRGNMWAHLSRIGGLYWWRGGLLIVRPLRISLCLLFGSYGTKGMLVSFITSMLLLL
jgi:hypothetical protein